MISSVIRRIACAIALASVSLFAQPVTVDSLLKAYWPFERAMPFASNDESQNHYNLIGIQGITNAHLSPGPYGNFLGFDSVGCETVVGESMGKFNSTTFTFAAFVHLQGPAKLQTLFQNSAAVSGGKAGYIIQIAQDSTIRVVFGDSVHGSWNTVATSSKISGIAHIAVTYDGANVQTFINGILASSNPYTGSFTPGKGSAIFGGNSVDGEFSNLFKDQIDEVRIYSRVLSKTEIWNLAYPPKLDVTGCWNVQQNGPGQVYTGTMSLTQQGESIGGTISWNSAYGSTTVTGTISGDSFTVVGSWSSPSPVTVTYTGILTTYGTVIVNGTSKDNGSGSYGFSANKIVCTIPPVQDTASICYTTKQEKSPGSGTWWTGTMNVQVLSNGTVIGGTIDWDVPSHGTVTGGTISGGTASINTHNVTYSMDVTYSGALAADSSIVSGTSTGGYAFSATRTSCSLPPPPPATTTQCWSTRQEKSPGSGTYWTGLLQIVIDANNNITGGTITWDAPSQGVVTGGSISGNTISVATHNTTYDMDITYSGTLSNNGNSIINGTSGGAAAFDATKTVCP